ncbi:DNA repair protein rad16 [Lobulomyces angularis]|nr:DNA repair protein rad16 [Lobulomyces angularis]
MRSLRSRTKNIDYSPSPNSNRKKTSSVKKKIEISETGIDDLEGNNESLEISNEATNVEGDSSDSEEHFQSRLNYTKKRAKKVPVVKVENSNSRKSKRSTESTLINQKKSNLSDNDLEDDVFTTSSKNNSKYFSNSQQQKGKNCNIKEISSDDESRKKKKKNIKVVKKGVFDDSGSEFSLHSDSASEEDANKYRVIKEESESEVEDNSSKEKVPAVVGKKRSRKSAPPKTPKYNIYDGHPDLLTIWDELENVLKEKDEVVAAEQPKDVLIKLLPFQLEGLNWLQSQETSRFNGGILADEMGMGKTIQMIGLVVTQPVKNPNLIICPTVALLQWYGEFQERVTKDLFKVLVYHGTDRITKKAELLEYDVILSTYSIIEASYRKQHYGVKKNGNLVKSNSLLHSIEWGRIILDEAHAIKDRSCSTARGVFALKSSRKWSITGTPLQNRVGELYSLIRFLDADPFSWNKEILKPIQNFGAVGEGQDAFKKLGLLLDNIMIRRTKIEKADDLGLPPRVVTCRRDVFNEAEEELYESLYSDSKRSFSTYVNAGTVLNNYANIFSLLSRMRLAANHPELVTQKFRKDDDKTTLVCGLCSEEAEDAVLSKCKHVFCREDAKQFIEIAPPALKEDFVDIENPLIYTRIKKGRGKQKEGGLACPVCFAEFSIDLTQPEVTPEDVFGKSAVESSKSVTKLGILNKIDLSAWKSSTKIEALVSELTDLQKEGQTLKSIVFSQFVSFLDLIQWRLARSGFSCVKLDGRMSPKQRDLVIKKFMQDPTVTVFLVSLKAGGVALNLTEASRVFVMDPWWNGAVEDQAFDRIHRLGQHRPIRITRMIIENSIESRILQLQEKKKALFDSTVGKDVAALAKLSEEDLQFLFVL